MIKVRKIDFGGYCMDISATNTGLNAFVLKRDYIAEQGDFEPEEIDIWSKIVTLQGDFSIKEIVSERNVEFAVCACYGNSVIYRERLFGDGFEDNMLYRSTNSQNEYISKLDNSGYRVYDNVFIIEEGDDYSNSQKVTAFDTDLNIIKSCVTGYDDLNEYEVAKQNSMRNYERYRQMLREKYSDIVIFTETENYEEVKKYNADPNYTFVASCFDRKVQKDYLIKFNKNADILWKTEIVDDVLATNVKDLNNCYYVLNNAHRGYKHWLKKYSENGELLDVYEFKASGGQLCVYNNKLVIVYDDVLSLQPWQKKAYKEDELFLCPSSLLVIDEWD